MSAVKVGDEITLLWGNGTHALFRAKISRVDKASGTFDAVTQIGTWTRFVTTEGITWIRGRHKPDSPEAKALLVAWALR